jgi:hypothetical protein
MVGPRCLSALQVVEHAATGSLPLLLFWRHKCAPQRGCASPAPTADARRLPGQGAPLPWQHVRREAPTAIYLVADARPSLNLRRYSLRSAGLRPRFLVPSMPYLQRAPHTELRNGCLHMHDCSHGRGCTACRSESEGALPSRTKDTAANPRGKLPCARNTACVSPCRRLETGHTAAAPTLTWMLPWRSRPCRGSPGMRPWSWPQPRQWPG